MSKLKMLDCFCGLGGVSDGFAKEGFDVLGIDIEDMPSKGYKHKFMRADMRTLKILDLPIEFQNPDVVWGSPPCRDFSCVGDVFGHTWKRPPDPEGAGMELVNAYLQFKDELKAKIWIMENVPKLEKYHKKAKFKTSLGDKHMFRCFWGNFPPFLMPKAQFKNGDTVVYHHFYPSKSGLRKRIEGRIYGIQGKNRKWERAYLPKTCSRAFAQACKRELLACKSVSEESK